MDSATWLHPTPTRETGRAREHARGALLKGGRRDCHRTNDAGAIHILQHVLEPGRHCGKDSVQIAEDWPNHGDHRWRPSPEKEREVIRRARAKFPKSSKTSAARDRVRDNGKMHQRVRRDIFAYSFPNWVTEVTSAEGGPTEGPRALEESVSEPHVSKFSRRGWLREGRGNSGGQQNAAWPRIIPRVFGTIRMRRGRTARARGYLRGLRRRMRDPSRISGNFRIGRRSASLQQIRDTLGR